MYLYFNRNRELKEIINNDSISVGDENTKIYIYVAELEPDECWYRFRLEDGSHYPSAEEVSDTIVTKKLPYNEKRDLKFFNYKDDFKFVVIDIPSDVLSMSGVVSCTVRVDDDGMKALGLITFDVSYNNEEAVYQVDYDGYISISQFNYLISIFGSEHTFVPYVGAVDNVDLGAEGLYTTKGIFNSYEEGQFSGGLWFLEGTVPTLISTDRYIFLSGFDSFDDYDVRIRWTETENNELKLDLPMDEADGNYKTLATREWVGNALKMYSSISQLSTLNDLYQLIGTSNPSIIQVGSSWYIGKLAIAGSNLSFEFENLSNKNRFIGSANVSTVLANIFNTNGEYFEPYNTLYKHVISGEITGAQLVIINTSRTALQLANVTKEAWPFGAYYTGPNANLNVIVSIDNQGDIKGFDESGTLRTISFGNFVADTVTPL